MNKILIALLTSASLLTFGAVQAADKPMDKPAAEAAAPAADAAPAKKAKKAKHHKAKAKKAEEKKDDAAAPAAGK